MSESSRAADRGFHLSPAARFPLLFLGLALAQFALLAGPLAEIVPPAACEMVAAHSHWLLSLFGEDVRLLGSVVSAPSRGYSFLVIDACTSVSASVLLISAMLAFPVSWRRKIVGIGLGLAALYLVNLSRLIMLFYCRLYWPDAYDVLHYSVWQSLLVVLAIVIFFVWATWGTRGKEEVQSGTA